VTAVDESGNESAKSSSVTGTLPTTGTGLDHDLKIGVGAAGRDYALRFDGETNDGIFTWMEDEDYFLIGDDILILAGEKSYFRDIAIYVGSNDDGHLDLVADTSIDLQDKLFIEADGDTYWSGDGAGIPYGAFGGDEIAWTQAGAVQNTWYEITDTDTYVHEVNEVTFTDSELTVLIAGRYEIIYAVSIESSIANQHLQAGIMINAGTPTRGINHVQVLGITSSVTISGVAIIDLAANDVVSLAVRTTDAGTPDITVDHIMMSLKMVGGT
jgi:hypothetical protein